MVDQGLVTVRNLKDLEFGGTPLRKFYGILESIYPEERTFGPGSSPQIHNVLNFKEVEVIETVEPYNFPIAVISIKASDKKSSGWGLFGESLLKFLSEDEDIKDCVGRKFGLEMEVGHVYGKDRQTGEDMTGNPWLVFELEGASAEAPAAKDGKVKVKVTAGERAEELLDNKTRAEFNKSFYADPLCRKDTALQRSVTDKSFINSLVQLGKFTEDEDGVFHKVNKEN